MGIIVLSRGRSGEILIKDEREDGTQVFLVCRPYDDERTTGVFAGPGPADDDGVYPMLEARFKAAAEPPFKLTLDTSRLPAGQIEFRSEAFILKAGEIARSGADHVTLRPEDLPEWGFVSPGGDARG